MPPVLSKDAKRITMREKRTRYHAHTNNVMMVVFDFDDGPQSEPDVPHQHPHEQVSYVVEGRLLFFLDGVPHEMSAGDMMTVPPNVPHGVQLLTAHARIVDAFNPVREDFLTSD